MNRRSWGWLALVAVLAALGLAAAGCGGDDDDGEGTETTTEETSEAPEEPTPPTKAEYVKALDKTCTQSNNSKEFKQIVADTNAANAAFESAGTDPAALEQAARDSAAAARARAKYKEQRTEEILKIEQPSSGPPSEYLKAREKQIALTEQVAKAADAYAKALDPATSEAFGQAVDAANVAIEEEVEAAEKFGLKVCAQPIK